MSDPRENQNEAKPGAIDPERRRKTSASVRRQRAKEAASQKECDEQVPQSSSYIERSLSLYMRRTAAEKKKSPDASERKSQQRELTGKERSIFDLAARHAALDLALEPHEPFPRARTIKSATEPKKNHETKRTFSSVEDAVWWLRKRAPKGSVEVTVGTTPEPELEVARAAESADARYDRVVAAAKARGAERVAEILRRPDMRTSEEIAEALGVSRTTITNKRTNKEILALAGAASRRFRFPAWQVADFGHLMPGLKELHAEFGGDPWSVYRFLVRPCPELDGAIPKDLMWQGPESVAKVLAVAENMGRGITT